MFLNDPASAPMRLSKLGLLGWSGLEPNMQGVADTHSRVHAQHAPSATAGMHFHRLSCAGRLTRWHLAVSVSSPLARLQHHQGSCTMLTTRIEFPHPAAHRHIRRSHGGIGL